MFDRRENCIPSSSESWSCPIGTFRPIGVRSLAVCWIDLSCNDEKYIFYSLIYTHSTKRSINKNFPSWLELTNWTWSRSMSLSSLSSSHGMSTSKQMLALTIGRNDGKNGNDMIFQSQSSIIRWQKFVWYEINVVCRLTVVFLLWFGMYVVYCCTYRCLAAVITDPDGPTSLGFRWVLTFLWWRTWAILDVENGEYSLCRVCYYPCWDVSNSISNKRITPKSNVN